MIIFYDSTRINSDSEKYMNAIRKKIKEAVFLDIQSPLIHEMDEKLNRRDEKIPAMFIKPMEQKEKEKYGNVIDLEYDGCLSCTAEAVLETLGDVRGKTVMIINQSEEVGQSLAMGLIRKRATVISVGSQTRESLRDELLEYTDILITATGDNDFRLIKKKTEKVKIIIDLSNDTEDERAIRYIPTVDVLKKRVDRY